MFSFTVPLYLVKNNSVDVLLPTMEPFSLPLPPPLPTPPPRDDLPPPPSPPLSPESPTRVRPPPSEQIQVVRELWVLRERGAVRALEPDFLMRLAFLLGGGVRVREARRDSHWVRGVSNDENTDDNTIATSERVRELPVGSARRDVDAARAQRRVSRLSPSFRARLEGLQADIDANRTMTRTTSWSDLVEQRAVTNTLESGFRHELEGMLVRRGNRDNTRYYAQSVTRRPPPREMVGVEEPNDSMNGASSRDMRTALRSLQEEVAALKQVMDASFDVQLDIQRAVRQEVAAALNSNSSTKRVMAPATGSAGPSIDTEKKSERREVRPLGGGLCVICMERSIDSLLYACGHLWYVHFFQHYSTLNRDTNSNSCVLNSYLNPSTCAQCGRQLLAHGDKCPICRAPVRDVVVAFLAS